jgi:transcriptional regulator GlxA family with amidase domain
LNPEKQIICSICSGALIIAALGLLDGLTATTYPTTFEFLKKYNIDVIENRHIVTHGTIATAAGCLAAVDLMGWAMEKLYNEEVKSNVIGSILPVGQPYVQHVAL